MPLRHENIVRTLYTNTSDGVIIASFDQMIVGANPAARALLGYEESDLFGLHLSTVFASQPDYERLAKSIFDGDSRMSRATSDLVFRRLDKGEFPAETMAALMRDETGKKVGVLLHIRDLSEVMAMRERLLGIDLSPTPSTDDQATSIAESQLADARRALQQTLDHLSGVAQSETIQEQHSFLTMARAAVMKADHFLAVQPTSAD